MENEKLATELLHQVKVNARRWFIVAMVELVAIVVLILLLFLVPTEEYSVDQEADNAGTNLVIRGDYNGDTAEDYIQETP